MKHVENWWCWCWSSKRGYAIGWRPQRQVDLNEAICRSGCKVEDLDGFVGKSSVARNEATRSLVIYMSLLHDLVDDSCDLLFWTTRLSWSACPFTYSADFGALKMWSCPCLHKEHLMIHWGAFLMFHPPHCAHFTCCLLVHQVLLLIGRLGIKLWIASTFVQATTSTNATYSSATKTISARAQASPLSSWWWSWSPSLQGLWLSSSRLSSDSQATWSRYINRYSNEDNGSRNTIGWHSR